MVIIKKYCSNKKTIPMQDIKNNIGVPKKFQNWNVLTFHSNSLDNKMETQTTNTILLCTGAKPCCVIKKKTTCSEKLPKDQLKKRWNVKKEKIKNKLLPTLPPKLTLPAPIKPTLSFCTFEENLRTSLVIEQ